MDEAIEFETVPGYGAVGVDVVDVNAGNEGWRLIRSNLSQEARSKPRKRGEGASGRDKNSGWN